MNAITAILRRTANTAKLVTEIGPVDYSDALGGVTKVIVDGLSFTVITVDITQGYPLYNIMVDNAISGTMHRVNEYESYVVSYTDGPVDITEHLTAIHDSMMAGAMVRVESIDFLVWDDIKPVAVSKVKRIAKIAGLTVLAGAVSVGAGFAAYKWFNK